MAGYGLCGNGYIDLAIDSQDSRRQFSPTTSWATSVSMSMPLSLPISMDPTMAHSAELRNAAVAAAAAAAAETTATATTTPASASLYQHVNDAPSLLATWTAEQMSSAAYRPDPMTLHPAPPVSPTYPSGGDAGGYHTGSMDFLAAANQPSIHHAGVPMDNTLLSLDASAGASQWPWEEIQDFPPDLLSFANHHHHHHPHHQPHHQQQHQHPGLSSGTMAPASIPHGSPTDTHLEVRSLGSASSDNGWAAIEYPSGAVFNPSETLHLRTYSNSSHSDGAGYAPQSLDGFEEMTPPLTSPTSDVHVDVHVRGDLDRQRPLPPPPPPPSVSPAATVGPVAISSAASTASTASSSSATVSSGGPSPSSHDGRSPPLSLVRRPARKSPTTKATKPVIRRSSNPGGRKDTEKRVGRRRGPLPPERRKQAHEIRKLRACLRCKFLKKTCDKGEPCAGCQPSHARLWVVPCTRIDIKDVAYFMKDWKADYERHVRLEYSVGNIRGFSPEERTLYITHGYGFALPITAREVFVRDEECFVLDWVESIHETPLEFVASTARLSAGVEGISTELLSEYLDRHIDGGFGNWVDDHFEGTPFLTELLKIAWRYYLRERSPVIRKALKLVLAYNLTLHLTLVEGLTEDERLAGEVTDETSKFRGQTLAPVMINFEIKCALARMWRDLQKDVLEELSALYSSVYNGEKLKHWPTIFLLVALLLSVWEEMQFDCHYRVPDPAAAEKFCHEMENVPVGVIVGLFSAISHQLPAFSEWDTQKHHHLLHSNEAICDAMTEVREHVTYYEPYLRSRADATFDRTDFDCLSNKFLSKLVIRAN